GAGDLAALRSRFNECFSKAICAAESVTVNKGHGCCIRTFPARSSRGREAFWRGVKRSKRIEGRARDIHWLFTASGRGALLALVTPSCSQRMCAAILVL